MEETTVEHLAFGNNLLRLTNKPQEHCAVVLTIYRLGIDRFSGTLEYEARDRYYL